jgi:hypothetical protein
MKLTSWNIAIKWGVIYALLTLFWLSIESLVGLHDDFLRYRVVLTNIKYIPLFLIYFGCLRAYRQSRTDEAYPYSSAFLDGLKLTTTATLFSIPAQYISLRFFVPDFLSKMQAEMTQEQWMTIAEATKYFEFQNYMIQSILAVPATGLMITAVVALFVSRNSRSASPVK